ncbi:MAG: hypothetical protein U0V49_06245 [Saprospiraceae bacterium]
MTDIPFRTFVGARIQIIINLNDYEIIDATPFVNTGFVDPNSGDAIFETTQDIRSVFDPAFSGPEDGYFRFCMSVRKFPYGSHKTGFAVKIILNTGEELEYDSGFVNFNQLVDFIGVDNTSVTVLSQVAISNNPTLVDGLLPIPDIACSGDNGNQSFILHGTLIVDIPYCFVGTIYMDDGAIIKINDGVACNIGYGTQSYQRTTIDPCGKMWKSITVGTSATVNVINSTINDGLYGIELLTNAVANISNATYNNNYVGIFNSESSGSVVNVNDTKFIYEGSFKGNCWNCSGLRQFNRTFAGLDLAGGVSNVKNSTFSALLNGVRTSNSSSTVLSSTFNSISDYGTNNYQTGNPSNGKAVSAISDNADNLKVTGCTVN